MLIGGGALACTVTEGGGWPCVRRRERRWERDEGRRENEMKNEMKNEE